MRLVLSLLFLMVICIHSESLKAQIVNIEDKRSLEDTTGWFWRMDFGGNLTENTRSVLTLSGALRLDVKQRQGEWLLLSNYNLVRADQDRVLNDGFGHLRYGRKLGDSWAWESFTQFQYNRRLLIDLRALAGTGPRFILRDKDQFDLATGLLYMFEYNELGEELAVTRRDHRLSLYVSLQFKLAENANLASTSYYQPLLNNLGESRLSSINSLNLSLGKHFSFSTNISITYDGLLARLVEGVPSTSYQWKNLLRVSF